jgi:hypothetical protein
MSILLVVERDTPFMSILLAAELDAPCMSILLVMVRDTPCKSTLLAGWLWKGIQLSCTSILLMLVGVKGILIACQNCRKCTVIHPAGPYTSENGIILAI